jgi:hypothetical protein
MLENTLFYPIFLCQIFLLSYYFPSKIIARVEYVLNNHPASDYPRLYAHSEQVIAHRLELFRRVNQCLLSLGMILLVAMGVWDWQTGQEINQFVPWTYFMLQLVPVMLAEVYEYKQYKQMRKLDSRRRRSAELIPRKLFDYVSRYLVASAILALIAVLMYLLWLFGSSEKTWANFGILLAGNLLFAATIAWQVYGRKLDPFQAAADRHRQIVIVCKSLLCLSIVSSAFIASVVTLDTMELEFVSAAFMSFYCQAIALISPGIPLQMIRVEDIDFEVYRTGAPS